MNKVLLLDIGGVLVDLDWDLVSQSLNELAEESLPDIRSFLGCSTGIHRELMIGKCSFDAFASFFSEQLQINCSVDRFRKLWESSLKLKPVAVAFMESIPKDVRIVLFSDTDPVHASYQLEKLGLGRFIDKAVFSYETGFLKPEDGAFEAVLRVVDASPSECIFLDDKLPNVKAALKYGIRGKHFEGDRSFFEAFCMLRE